VCIYQVRLEAPEFECISLLGRLLSDIYVIFFYISLLFPFILMSLLKEIYPPSWLHGLWAVQIYLAARAARLAFNGGVNTDPGLRRRPNGGLSPNRIAL
jgi:hypothetical protein